MKIAIFHNLPRGGAKRVIYSLARELSKTNIVDEFAISTSANYLDLNRYVRNQIIYQYNQGFGIFEFVFNSLVNLRKTHVKIAKDIDKNEYDVVLVNHDFITKSPYILRYLKTPSIYICHEPPREYYENQDLHSPTLKDKLANLIRCPIKYVDRENFSYSTTVVTNSFFSREIIKKVYGRRSEVVYPGVDINTFKPHKIRKKNQIIMVGSLLPYKGSVDLVMGIGTIDAKQRPRLVIVGHGRPDEVRTILGVATECGVKIKIVDSISDHDLSKLYSSCIAVASLAFSEPFGLSIIEGMACGIPAIVVNDGGLVEQVKNGTNGYITTRDCKEIGRAIANVLNQQSLGANAARIVKDEWGWNKVADRIVKLANLKQKNAA